MANLNTTTDTSQYILNKCIDDDYFALDTMLFGEETTGGGTSQRVTTTTDGTKVGLDVALSSDIEIGAVELKDDGSDTRASIETDSAKNAIFVQSESLATATNQQTDGLTDTELRATAVPVTESSPLTGFATSALQTTQETSLDAIQTSVEIMDDWDETNRAAVNLIAGQVGVQGAAGASTALTQRVAVATDANTVKPNALKVVSKTSYDVDAAAVQVFDASAAATAVAVAICNAGDEDIYLYYDNTAGPYVNFKKLSAGETWEYPLGYTSDTTNDVWAERASAQANDNVLTIVYGEV